MSNEETLNWKEARIVKVLLGAANDNGALTLVQLAHRAFPGVRPREKRLSQVRNSLRNPTKVKLVKCVGKGTYKAVR